MSRKRVLGNEFRCNCIFALIPLLLKGKIASVQYKPISGSLIPHFVARTKRDNVIHFGSHPITTTSIWYMGQYEVYPFKRTRSKCKSTSRRRSTNSAMASAG